MKKLAIVFVTAWIAGCSSSPAEKYAEQQEQVRNLAVEQANNLLQQAPEWYLSPPKSDDYGIIGVGAATSSDMHHALKTARIQAEFELAKNYRQELSGSERVYERASSTGNLIQTSQFLIDKLVESVPVVGYELLEQQVQVLPNGRYQAYSLLKLPYDEFNKALQSIEAQSQSAQEKEAFSDLERRLEAKRNRNESASQREHERKLELMDKQLKAISGATSVQFKPEEVQNTAGEKKASTGVSDQILAELVK